MGRKALLLLLALAAWCVQAGLPAAPHTRPAHAVAWSAVAGTAVARAGAAPVFADVTWEHGPGDLGETVRIHDPDRPLLAGYRRIQELSPVDGVSLGDVTYWYYEDQLARIDITAGDGDREHARNALLDHLSSLHGQPGAGAAESPVHRWVTGDARIVIDDVGSDFVRVTVEHRERMACAEAAGAAMEADARFTRWLEHLKRHATAIRYGELMGSPNLHNGRAVRYRGRVIQVVDAVRWRIGIVDHGTIGAGNVVYVRYAGHGDPMVSPDAAVQFIGLAAGLFTYRSAVGTEVTVPEIHAYQVTLLP